jgi:hypothetical protein
MTSRLFLAFTLAACGSAHHTVDANRDTSSDTLGQPTGDAPPGATTIAVTSAGLPAANVAVYFQNADSTLVLGATTDAHGTVGVMLATGGYVTAIEPPDGSGVVKLDTFAGVHSGDALHLDLAPLVTEPGQITHLTVSTGAGAFAYTAYSSCGPVTVDATGAGDVGFAGCDTTTDLLVVDIDDSSNPLGAYYAPNVTIGPPPGDGGGYTTNVSGPAYSSGLTRTDLLYTGVPSFVAFIGTTQSLVAPHGRLYDGIAGSAPISGTTSHSIYQPAPTGLVAVTVTDLVPDASPNANQHGEQLVYDWDTWNAGYTLTNVSASMLKPYLSDAKYEVDTHKVTWTEGSGVMADFARGRVLAYRDAIPSGGTWQWSIIGGRTAAPELALPTLPVTDFDYNPKAGDLVSVADLTNVKAPGGYDGFRPHGFTGIAKLAGQGATGRVIVQLPYSPPL